MNRCQSRPGVEDFIEHEVAAFVQPEPEQTPAKELHNVARDVLCLGLGRG
jgi:hypothetical protein